MVDTEGGIGGGLARGLEAGANLFGNIQDRAQRQQQFQQEMGLRQQEFGLQSRASDRLDQQSRLEANKAGVDATNEAIDALIPQQTIAEKQKDFHLSGIVQEQLDKLNAVKQQHLARIYGGDVYDQGTQALSDANALKNKTVTPEQLGPQRFSNVYTLTGHPAIDYVDHPDHPDGVSPIGQAVSNAQDAVDSGNLNAATQHLAPLVVPHMSGYEPGHDLHVPGISSPYGTPDGDHPHIGQIADIAGAKGTLNAATMSDPSAVALIHQAHDDGVTDQQKQALNFVHQIGGPQQLKQFSTNSPLENQYQDKINSGATPAQAAQDLKNQTLEDYKSDIQMAYIKRGRPIPAQFQDTDKEKALKALRKANPNMSEGDLVKLAYVPELATAEARERIEAPGRTLQNQLLGEEIKSIQQGRGRWGTGGPGGAGVIDPNDKESAAQAIANYDMPAPTGRNAYTPQSQSMMARVRQINPDYAASDYDASKHALDRFDSGKQGDTIRSFNVLVNHLNTLKQAGEALNNGNLPLLNRIGNAISQETGHEAPTDFDGVKGIVADELVKSITGSGGALGDREELAKRLSSASSPEQLQGIIKHYTDLAGAQLRGYRKEYEASTKRKDFDNKYLDTGTLEALGGAPAPQGGQKTPTGPAGSSQDNPVKVSTKEQRDALSPGIYYVGPDGHVSKK